MHEVEISPLPVMPVDLVLPANGPGFPGSTGVRAACATAMTRAWAPTLTTVLQPVVTAVVAVATGVAGIPNIGGSNAGFVGAVKASASAGAPFPVVKGDALVTAVKASASANALAPVVSSGVIVNGTVNAVLATGASGLAVPTVSGEVVLTGGGPATASALASVPVVTGASGGGTVLFDAVGAGASSVNSVASLSWTHTATGTARAVFVALAVDTQATQGTFSTWTRSATYGGTAMTLIAARDSNDAPQGFVQLFGLLNPPTGAQTVVASATKSGITPARLIANSVSYTAVTSFGTGVTGIANNTVPSLAVSSAANHRAIAVFASAAAISAPTQTQRYLNNAAVGNAVSNVLIQDAAGAATVTFSAANNADWWALVGVDILP